MSLYSDSHWVTGYTAKIHNVYVAVGAAAIEFSYNGLWYVGWRQLLTDLPEQLTPLVNLAIYAKQSQVKVWLRVTNGGEGPHGEAVVTGIQTAGSPMLASMAELAPPGCRGRLGRLE